MMRVRTLVGVIGIVMVSLGIFAGCSAQKVTVSPDNLVTAANLTLQVTPEFPYLGEARQQGFWEGTTCSVMQESHFFGQIDNNRYDRGVIVTSLAFVDSSYRWSGGMFGETMKKQALDTGVSDQDKTYQYVVLASSLPLYEHDITFVKERQYQFPRCMLVKILGAQQSTDQRRYIKYFEALPTCQSWKPGKLTNDQQTRLAEFLQRSEEYLVFQ